MRRNLFQQTAEKAKSLNYGIINDVMVMQYIYQ